MARAASSWRLRTPSLRKIDVRWDSTVRGLMNSLAATSRFDAPPTTSRATCSSCGVSRRWDDDVVADRARRRHGTPSPPGRRRPSPRPPRNSSVALARWARASARWRARRSCSPHDQPGPAPRRTGCRLRRRGRRGRRSARSRDVVVVGEQPWIRVRSWRARTVGRDRRRRGSSEQRVGLVAPPGAGQRLDPLRLPADEAAADRRHARRPGGRCASASSRRPSLSAR